MLRDFLSEYVTFKREKKPLNKELFEFDNEILKAQQHNLWFTEPFVLSALEGICKLLDAENLSGWLDKYANQNFEKKHDKTVGIIMAGNIPAVGFHDLLCVLLTGNDALVKLSHQDRFIIPAILKLLSNSSQKLSDKVTFTDNKINNVDAIIATGNDNSAQYFLKYFQSIPHIIRHNRYSVAILRGDETKGELEVLSDDIFLYFGLGCRNVSKIFIPENLDINSLREPFSKWQHLMYVNRFANNYDYYKAVNTLNKTPFVDFGFLMLVECEKNTGHVAELSYQKYSNETQLIDFVEKEKNYLQCVVCNRKLLKTHSFSNAVPFGKSQFPAPWDYADNIDTIKFLLDL